MATGIPPSIRACLFDMDGVLTDTAKVHAAAWKAAFDEFLGSYRGDGDTGRAFDPVADYDRYVDGRSREDGTRAFLESRGITLPDGPDGAAPGAPTVRSISDRKNEILLERIRADGVDVFDDTLALLRAMKARGLATAVVTASANAAEVLRSTGLSDLFDARVDGVVAAERGLAGKPAPDMFLAAAEMLGVAPDEAAVFEDALAGVEAGRAGGFGLVVGVDRVGQADALSDSGADIVVDDVASLIGGERT